MLNKYLSGITLVMLLGYSCVAVSQTSRATAFESPLDKRFYIAPMVSYGFFDQDVDTNGDLIDFDDDVGVRIAIGKPLFSFLNLELQALYFDDVENMGNGRDVDMFGYGISTLLFPFRERFPVFGILGYSYGDYEFSGSKPNAHYLDVGLGYSHQVSDHGLAIRGEYRFRSTELDGGNDYGADFDDHIVSLGLQIPLGARPELAPPAKPVQAPPPRQGPRPEPQPVQPLDSDGDGVPDNRDQCPGTPPGTRVDQNGCPEDKTDGVVLKGVTFEYDSARLTAQAERRLDNVLNALRVSQDIDARVEGHTDSIGNATYNRQLSQRRANAVKRYLVNHGIAGNRLITEGYGETRPVAPNTKPDGSDNPAGRAKNRRVELHVIR